MLILILVHWKNTFYTFDTYPSKKYLVNNFWTIYLRYNYDANFEQCNCTLIARVIPGNACNQRRRGLVWWARRRLFPYKSLSRRFDRIVRRLSPTPSPNTPSPCPRTSPPAGRCVGGSNAVELKSPHITTPLCPVKERDGELRGMCGWIKRRRTEISSYNNSSLPCQ